MPRKQKQYHYIYKTTNKITGRYYYGMHSTNDLHDGYLGSGKRLRYSINKYGENAHVKCILEFCGSRDKLKQREADIVTLNEIAKDDCMNLCLGGDGGGWTPEQQREFARRSNEKQKWLRENDKEWADRDSKTRSRALKQSYANGKRDRHNTPDWQGRKHKEETKRKIGIANSKHQTGKGNSQYGTCWVCLNGVAKKISKDELPVHLNHGWKRGRK